LPLALLPHAPKNALVICFGMGTTHRSMLSWGIASTSVELLPSVPQVFAYFHPDGPELLKSANSRLIIDDGRMFLEKTREKFDVISIDPPPPIQAAGVSLLYSREFYEAAKKRLASGGILQQWFYAGDQTTIAAVVKALQESFPYVRAYGSVERIGAHFVASMSPLPNLSAAELARKLPAAAAQDFVEWGPQRDPEQQFALLLRQELSLAKLAQLDPLTAALHDDKPVNEYCWLRQNLPASVRHRVFAMLASWQATPSSPPAGHE
jgi:spermidine synthase